MLCEYLSMKHTKNQAALGLGQLERQRLSQLLQHTKVTISVTEAAEIWKMNQAQAAKLLSWYQKKGWLKRIVHGVYIAVPLEAQSTEVIPEEPFVIAEKLFAPCYISGMNAANYWDLTEQLFQTVTVMTENKVMKRKQKIANTTYLIHTIKSDYFFGLKTIWLNDVKVRIADPTRTLIDMMMYPQFCGGIRFIEDVLKSYFHSKNKNVELLLNYLEKITNGAAIKRLGYLLEKNFPDETKLIDFCLNKLTKGYANLSPSIDCPRVVTHWRLRVPENWKDSPRDK